MFARIVWLLLVGLLLSGWLAAAWYVVPRALSADSAVRFVSALSTRQDGYNYSRLAPGLSSRTRSGSFEAQCAAARHQLVQEGLGSIDMSSARLGLTAQGAIVLVCSIDGQRAEMPIDVRFQGPGRSVVTIVLSGAQAAQLPLRLALTSNVVSWKIDGLAIGETDVFASGGGLDE